jgi:hypothetical protein
LLTLKNVDKKSKTLIEDQQKALGFINQHWADAMLQKAEEAGQAQAAVFGRSVAKEAVASIQTQLQAAHQSASQSATQLQQAAHALDWKRLFYTTALSVIIGCIVLLGMNLLTPSLAEIQALRQEKAQMEATIARLEQKGGYADITVCGDKRKLCAQVVPGEVYGAKGDNYMILRTKK